MILIYIFIANVVIGAQSISTIDIEESNSDLLERRILGNRARNALTELKEDMKVVDSHTESRREKLLGEVSKTPRIRSLKPFATQKIESSKRKRSRAQSVKTVDNIAIPMKTVERMKENVYEDKMSELRAEYNRLKKKVMERLRRRKPARMAVMRNNQELYQPMKVSIDPMFIALDDFQQFNDISDAEQGNERTETTEQDELREIKDQNIVGNTLFQDELSTPQEAKQTTKTVARTIDSTRLKISTDIEDITKMDEEQGLDGTTTVMPVEIKDVEDTITLENKEPVTKPPIDVEETLIVRAVLPVKPIWEVPETTTEPSFQTETPTTKGLNPVDPTTNTVTLFQVDDEAQPKYFYDSRKVPSTPFTRHPYWRNRVSTVDSDTYKTSELNNKRKIIVTEKVEATVIPATAETTTVTTSTAGPSTEPDVKVVDLTELDEEVKEEKVTEETTTSEPTTESTTTQDPTTTTTVTQSLRIQPKISTAEEIVPKHVDPVLVVPTTTEIPEIIRKHLQTTTPLAFVTATNQEATLNELELFSNSLILINGAKALRNEMNVNTTDWTLEQVESELAEKKRALAELEKLHEYVSHKENQHQAKPRRRVSPRKAKRARGSKLQQIQNKQTQHSSTVSPDLLELQNALNEIKFFEATQTTTPSPINIVNWKEEMLSQNTIFPSLSTNKKKYQSASKPIEKEKKAHKKKRRYFGSSEKTTKRGAHKKGMVESISSLITMLEAENRSIRSAETEFCRRTACDFERGDFCEFESSFDEVTRKKAKRTKRQSDEPFYVLRSWSNWIGLPYQTNLRIDKSPFFDSRNSRFAGVFLDPREVATLSLRTNFSQSFSLTLALFEATRGVRLRICCDQDCPFSTEYGIHRGHKKWMQRTVNCPAKTKNIIIECVNSSDRFRGACGIDNLTLIKPLCLNELKA